MTKSLEQFKTDTMNGRFGVPGTSNTNLGDPAYAGQCVSYVRLYMEEVLGIKTAVWGHAVNYWTNPSVLKYFDKVSTPQDGDIVVWEDDEGNWTGPEGHIAVCYGGQLLNQNYGGNLKVTLNKMFSPGLLGYLRPKGGDMAEKVNLDTARILAAGCGTRDGFDNRPDAHGGVTDEDLKKYHVGKELTNDYIRKNWFASDEASQRFAINKAVYAERDKLRNQLATIKPGEAEAKLQAIKDALGVK
jgi:hypothetical protein